MLFLETVDGVGFIPDRCPVEDDSFSTKVDRLHLAIVEIRPVRIKYTGGTSPGRWRTILPSRICDDLDWCGPSCYAWCAQRQAPRLFLIGRIAAIRETLRSVTFPFHQALGDLYLNPQPMSPLSRPFP